MKKIRVITGFGYYTNASGDVTDKAQLPIGSHELAGDFTYHEVSSKVELNAVEVYKNPVEIADIETEKKIQDKMRSMAIAGLMADNKLPMDFVDKRAAG